MLKLPIPEVKVWCKEGGSYWNLRVHVPGRKNPKTKDISILDIAATKKQAISKAMHEVVTRLTYLYQEELHRLGVQTFGKRTATNEVPMKMLNRTNVDLQTAHIFSLERSIHNLEGSLVDSL